MGRTAFGGSGTPGPQGEVGPEGPEGPEGPVGPDGPQGDPGAQGDPGPEGDPGADGGPGVVAATAPATYDGGTQTVGVTVGTGAGTVAAGNDSRLSDTRTPTDGSVTDAKVAAANKDGTAGTPSLRTLGTGATQAAAGTDSRLSDVRTPSDASVTPAKFAATAIDPVAGTAGARTLGTGAQQAAAGTDSRLSDTRTPTDATVTPAKFAASAIDPAAGTAGARTLGTGAAQAAPGNDSRLSDSRTPTAHATTHDQGGSDPLYYGQGHTLTSAVENIPRTSANAATTALGSGAIAFCFFTPNVNLTVSQIGFATAATPAAVVTTVKYGLYTVDSAADPGSGAGLVLVARTDNDATLLTVANTYYPKALSTAGGFPASYALVRGTRYAIAVLVVATTPPTFRGSLWGNTGMAQLPPPVARVKTGQTDLLTPSTALSAASGAPWAVALA